MRTATPELSQRGADRRRLIVAAAIAIISEDGVAALTHRRVAARAEVPLAATTYYFDSRGGLLASALAEIAERDVASARERLAPVGDTHELVARLAEMLVEWTGPGRQGSLVTSELSAAALRYEDVREVALRWNRQWSELLESHLDAGAAAAVMATMTGVTQRALLEQTTVSAGHAATLLRRSVGDS